MRVRGLSLILFVIPSLVGADENVSAEKAMGGEENLRAVLKAEVVSFERITVPPGIRIVGFVDNRPKFEELTVNNWSWGMRLLVVKGPVAVPSSIVVRLREVLMAGDVIPDIHLGSRYYPTHRFELKEDGHTLEIFVMETTGDFETYRDGVRIGSHSGDLRIIKDLEDLLEKMKEATNQPLEPLSPKRGGSS